MLEARIRKSQVRATIDGVACNPFYVDYRKIGGHTRHGVNPFKTRTEAERYAELQGATPVKKWSTK